MVTLPLSLKFPSSYVFVAPHIGHLYSAVITDAISRFERLLNPEGEFLFSTGTDEHGSKIQQAAAKNNVTTREYCDTISAKYRKLFDEACVCPTRFIRTTDKDHQVAVQTFWVKGFLEDFDSFTHSIIVFHSKTFQIKISFTPQTTVVGIACQMRLFWRIIS